MRERNRFTRDSGKQLHEQEKVTLSWDERVVLASCVGCTTLIYNSPGISLEPIVIAGTKGRETDILSDLYDIEREFQDDAREGRMGISYIEKKGRFLKSLAKGIKDKRQFYIFPKLINIVSQPGNFPDVPRTMLTFNIISLYLLVCGPNRALVGLKDGIYWKNIQWPTEDKDFKGIFSNDTLCYLHNLHLIGRKELIVVPDGMIPANIWERVRIPRSRSTLEYLIEDAYYSQRYIVPPAGAEVRFRRSGDLERMVLIQSGDILFARIFTSKGEAFLWLNLDNLNWFINASSSDPYRKDRFKEPNIVLILGEVYHDLVTAIELPQTRYKDLGARRGLIKLIGRRDQPQVVYIPRIVHTGRIERPPYEGPPRPVVPHRVVGHKRRANLTEEHRLELIEFEKRTGIKVLENLPAGYTFVRPYVVPKGSEDELRNLPTFIKRKIETQLARELKTP
ncbi:MAG: hypothetical protein HYS83_01095 [Candidatus Blackburnbacteria bacterium]|nr:hypothetical protein [Candidatus Blackburnbacteria bacterium]